MVRNAAIELVSSVDGGTFLLDRMAKGKPIISHGDGLSLWSECHADDVAAAFAAACRAMGAPAPDIVHIPTKFIRRFDPEYGSYSGSGK